MLLVPTYVAQSPIHGLGCFSVGRIARGQPVWRYMPGFDVRMSGAFAIAMCRPGFLETYTENDGQSYLLCADDARFINHSDEPTVESHAQLFDGVANCALRDIAADEELTMDYRLTVHRFEGFGYGLRHADIIADSMQVITDIHKAGRI